MVENLIGASSPTQKSISGLAADSVDSLLQTQSVTKTNKGNTYDPGHLVGSSINNSRVDFRSPFLNKATTWGYVNGKINKNMFQKEYRREFVGKDSPPPGTYDPVDPLKFQKSQKNESKSMTRELRVCPIVSKH